MRPHVAFDGVENDSSIDFIDCPVRFWTNRLKKVFPSEWHCKHQNVYVKADLLKVTGRVPGGVAI